MEKDWLNSLRNRMENYEESTPAGLWDDISSSVLPQGRFRKAVILPWVWRTAAAAAVLAVGVISVVKLSERPDKSMVAENDHPVQVLENSKDNNSVIPQDGQASPQINSSSVIRKGNLAGSADGIRKQTLASQPEVSRPEELVALAEVPEQAENAVSEKIEQKEEGPASVGPEQNGFKTTSDGEDWSGRMSASDDNENGFSAKPDNVNLSVAGVGNGMQTVNELDTRVFYHGAAPFRKPAQAVPDPTDNATVETRSPMPASTVVTNTVDHKRPVRAGVSLRWPLGRIFGIETGLNYTRLSSTFTSASDVTSVEDSQTLQYLGIPLDFTAELLDSRLVTLYLSCGGMAEKCVSGKVKSTTTVSGVRSGNVESRNLEVKPLLWSLNAAAGVQGNISRNIGVYVEPGLSYHFDDGTAVQTIYKEHPLDFMMTFGVRVSFK